MLCRFLLDLFGTFSCAISDNFVGGPVVCGWSPTAAERAGKCGRVRKHDRKFAVRSLFATKSPSDGIIMPQLSFLCLNPALALGGDLGVVVKGTHWSSPKPTTRTDE
jgi:hypothetical protein